MPEDSTPTRMVRLLLNDVAGNEHEQVFSDDEVADFLTMEGGSVKRAAAQAIDTNADNELLASKVLSDHQISTNGAAVADSMRKRAAALRAQATDEETKDATEADGYFFGTATIVGGVDPHAWYV